MERSKTERRREPHYVDGKRRGLRIHRLATRTGCRQEFAAEEFDYDSDRERIGVITEYTIFALRR